MKNDDFKFAMSTFTDFMRLPNGTSLVSPEMLHALTLRGFFDAPASTKYHGNYPGGLLAHSYSVAKFLVRLTEDNHLTWKNPRSPFIVGMFHDLCKIDQYKLVCTEPDFELAAVDGKFKASFSTRYEYNPDTLLKGHGDKSVMLLSQFYTLTDEEIMCIRYHMGAFTDKSEWNDYTRAASQYPNVLWTHQADMLASHVAGV